MHTRRSSFRAVIRPLAAALLLLLVGLVQSTATARAAATSPQENNSSTSISLASVLNPDGTLKDASGVRGSFDARGWRLVSGDGQAPRFAPAVAGDERWAANFTLSGVSGPIYAMAADGSGNVYVGGYFNTAGGVTVNHIAHWNSTSGTWSALNYGLDDAVNALAVDGSILYVAGQFHNVCTNVECSSSTPIATVAKWNGSGWSALGNGLSAAVNVLAVDKLHNLYAVGSFLNICGNPACDTGNTPANRIAEWNGSWSPVGNGLDNPVSVLAVDSSNHLYVGGEFRNACGDSGCTLANLIPVNGIAYWNGSSFAPLGHGVDTNGVSALVVDASNHVYAGGFQYVCGNDACDTGNTQVNYIAKWSGSWAPLASGVDNSVFALALDASNNVYAGGQFTDVCAGLACPAGTGPRRVAQWNALAGNWSAVANGLDTSYLSALVVSGGKVYAAGYYLQMACGDATCGSGDVALNNIAVWDGTAPAWAPVGAAGDGVGGDVLAVAADGNGNVYVGGIFKRVGNVLARGVARWNGLTKTWSALGYGLAGQAQALALDSANNLYAGGVFYELCGNALCNSGNTKVNHIAKWDGSSWSPLSHGVYGAVRALAVAGTSLYVGGDFIGTCGDSDCTMGLRSPVNRIVKWTGSSWSAMANGVSGSVYALALDSSNYLYLGGSFDGPCTGALICNATTPLNNLAKWNNSTFDPVGNGVDRRVRALAFDASNNLYVGGDFQNTCGDSACTPGSLSRVNYIVKRTGSSWSPLLHGVDGYVYALTADPKNRVYTGGWFQNICGNTTCDTGNVPVNYLAAWNPSGAGAWYELGSGIGNFSVMSGNAGIVEALTFRNGAFYAGGLFERAGAKVSVNFAQYTDSYTVHLPLVER